MLSSSRSALLLGGVHNQSKQLCRIPPLRMRMSLQRLKSIQNSSSLLDVKSEPSSAQSGSSGATTESGISQDQMKSQPSGRDFTNPNDSHVPENFSDAMSLFFQQPSVILASCLIICTVLIRAQLGPLGWLDGVAFFGAVCLWIGQEWAIHKYLLHSSLDWLGKRIHEGHHQKPYHHVSVDGPDIVGPFMLLAAGVFWALLHDLGPGVVAAACCGYYLSGLLSYQLIHYLVHTRWVPQSQIMRSMRRHHMLHHLRNHDYWFAFSLPALDTMMGTAPDRPNMVPLNSATVVDRTSKQ